MKSLLVLMVVLPLKLVAAQTITADTSCHQAVQSFEDGDEMIEPISRYIVSVLHDFDVLQRSKGQQALLTNWTNGTLETNFVTKMTILYCRAYPDETILQAAIRTYNSLRRQPA